MTPEFMAWPKIPRWDRPVTITEKIDGTNACVIITEDGDLYAQSRTRLIYPGKSTDNFGFAQWCEDNAQELRELGPGYHYGEWYGEGIQRGYGLDEKRFALFNVDRWTDERPACCDVVPVLTRCDASAVNGALADVLGRLRRDGSVLAPEYVGEPEGVVVYHHAGRHTYKVLLENDNRPKGAS